MSVFSGLKLKSMKLIRVLLLAVVLCFGNLAFAGEGMWLPQLLNALNEGDMQTMGMKLTAEQVYSVNEGSLKDAIVHFGGFCTSEVISPEGLLLTNHHCGYGQIQSHSTIEDNYLKKGFWAATKADEKVNPGLFARFIERIDDVSEIILKGVNDDMSPSEVQSIVDKNINAYMSDNQGSQYEEWMVRPFFNGNQYFAFKTVTYPDVRLVGAPPENIGKFGADTDNWVWPRHTGDFSLFRIYAGTDNQPAEYSADNQPFVPKHYLPISMDGVSEGDFTMVFGFPGRTNQYLPSQAVRQIVEINDPAKIEIRDVALKIMDKYMRADEKVRLQYSSKFARIANYWKKWIGEKTGLEKTNAVAKKQDLEEEFTKRVKVDSKLWGQYGHLMKKFGEKYAAIERYSFTKDYYDEVVRRNVEIMTVASVLDRMVSRFENNGEAGYNDFKPRVAGYLENHFKNYNANIDQEVFIALSDLYRDNVDREYCPTTFSVTAKSLEVALTDIFQRSAFNDQGKLKAIFEMSPEDAVKAIKGDPIYILFSDWKGVYDEKVAGPYSEIKVEIDLLQKRYMRGLIDAFPEKTFWPDANSTMRVTYGKVQGYEPRDAVYYKPVTHFDGVVEKYIPDDYEFDLDEKLLDLYRSKDYGPYADETGSVPVCFIGTNHTTGGNSGSPAIDAEGNLIGLNFDRAWEGTMSDINYDPSICRNIMVDIRYVLFVVDKYAGASHLIEEMTLVHPKTK